MWVHTCAFCKCTAAHMHMWFVFNMLWSYRNRGSTCLSYSVEEWTQLGGGLPGADCAWPVLVGGMSRMCSRHTGNAVRVELQASSGVKWSIVIGVTKVKIRCYYDSRHRKTGVCRWLCGYVWPVLSMRLCLPDVLSRLKAILTSDLSGDTLLVEVIIYPFIKPKQSPKQRY